MKLLDLLFPRRCVDCGALGSYICKKCIAGMRQVPVDGHLCSLVEYKGLFEKILKTAKYGNYEAILNDLAERLCVKNYEKILKYVVEAGVEVCIPVPLHKNRLKERGFNQSVVIAKRLCKVSQIKIDEKIVVRAVNTARLAGMDKKGREMHIQGAFKAVGTVPKSCLLVDDVFTTGSTLRELARTLKAAGAEDVFVFTLARRWYNQA